MFRYRRGLNKTRRALCCTLVLMSAACLFGSSAALGAQEKRFESEVDRAFAGNAGAAVVLRVADGRVLAVHDLRTATARLLTPGSTIKPFTLELLLDRRLLSSSERIACRRGTRVAGKALDCTHSPAVRPFVAAEALAYSCNAYFVEAAKRLPPGELDQQLRQIGLTSAPGLLPGEAQGRVAAARKLEARQLLAIGAAGIEVTPVELASAYAKVARWTKSPTAAQRVVLDGLNGATSYGLAQLAQPEGMRVAGKTGTASQQGEARTHGWFAGFAPAEDPEVVVVVFVERGRGSVEAATVARRIFETWARKR